MLTCHKGPIEDCIYSSQMLHFQLMTSYTSLSKLYTRQEEQAHQEPDKKCGKIHKAHTLLCASKEGLHTALLCIKAFIYIVRGSCKILIRSFC